MLLKDGTDLSALKATFTASAGASVKVGEIAQVSGETANDFSAVVTYNVYSESDPSANPKTYAVTVTLLSAPAITGIENSGSYITTQQATITGDNITKVTLDGTDVSLASAEALEVASSSVLVDLPGNVEHTYTIVATNSLEMETSFTITMAPIATIGKPIENLNGGNVKSSDQAAITSTKDAVTATDTTHATEEEKAALNGISDNCDSLTAKIDTVTKAMEDAKNLAGSITADNVGLGDKAALEASQAAMDKVLAENPDNFTPEERQEQATRQEEIKKAIITVDHAQAVIDIINSLPDSSKITLDDTAAIEAAQKAYSRPKSLRCPYGLRKTIGGQSTCQPRQ